MAYEAKHRKTYNQSAERISQSLSEIIVNFGGKESPKSNPAKGRLDANFNKKIKGEYINNRVQLQTKIDSKSPDQCMVSAMAYPVDPVGEKLAFGVQGDPARVVIDTFFAELDTQFGS